MHYFFFSKISPPIISYKNQKQARSINLIASNQATGYLKNKIQRKTPHEAIMGSIRNRRSYLSVHTCQAATDHVCVTRANSLAGVDVCRDLKHCTSTLRSFSRKYGKSRIASHLSCKETNITPKTNKQHADTNTIL